MSGILGFTTKTESTENIRSTLISMSNRLAHRGRNGYDEYTQNGVAFAMRRFGDVNIHLNESYALMFDGQIYNHTAEELPLLFSQHGHNLPNKLRGAFALAVHDKKNNELFLARDFFGTKPLFYTVINDNLVFGSEIKCFWEYPGFVPILNEEALEHYMTFQYSVLPETFFKGVYRIPAGHYLTYKNGEMNIGRYFTPEFTPKHNTLSNTCERITDVLTETIQTYTDEKKEIGAFLSSGVDSSYIAASFNGEKTFTVGYSHEKYNEINYAMSLSDKIGKTNISKTITGDEYWDVLPKVQYHMDEPLADPSAVALYIAGGMVKEHVDIILSGEGADEFFGGYNIYREPLDLQIVTWIPKFLRRLLRFLVNLVPFSFRGKSFFNRAATPVERRYIGNARVFSVDERNALLKTGKTNIQPEEITKPIYERHAKSDDITKMQLVDINMWLAGDILQKADRMTMAHSLSVRSPFLDIEVFRTASQIQTDYRVNRVETKYAFRLVAKQLLPDNVADKKKLGFPVPLREWLREDKHKETVRKYFTNETAEKYFNTDKLISLLNTHKAGKRDNSRKIWTVFTFLVWYEQFFS
jgi:asparagine synthase (glutamine-hydrolysing)